MVIFKKQTNISSYIYKEKISNFTVNRHHSNKMLGNKGTSADVLVDI